MAWYAAHAIMYFQLTDGPQDSFQVHENVYLVQADAPNQAWDKAQRLARRDEVDNHGSLRVGERPAQLVFGSIRKVVSVAHEGPDGQLGDGDELTYSEFSWPIGQRWTSSSEPRTSMSSTWAKTQNKVPPQAAAAILIPPELLATGGAWDLKHIM
jgi:hypothetical protein